MTNSFTIYDLKNKFIAYSDAFSNVAHVMQEWGCLFVLTQEGKVFSSVLPVLLNFDHLLYSLSISISLYVQLYQLKEKDTATKLDNLFKRKLFTVAINLAVSQNLDTQSVMDIFIRYGNHLYDKKDYDGAMQQVLFCCGVYL
jgi:hypothetical protein